MISLRSIVLCFAPCLLVLSSSLTGFGQKAESRVWTVEGQSVEATLIDFNGTQVLLQDANLFQEVFSAEQLSKKDVSYVKSKANELKLKIRNDRVLHGIDVWRVQLQSQNGSFDRNYQGVSSDAAMAAASAEFPNARIQGVSKLTSENRGIRARLRLQNLKQKQAKKNAKKFEKAQKAKKNKAKKAAGKGNKKEG